MNAGRNEPTRGKHDAGQRTNRRQIRCLLLAVFAVAALAAGGYYAIRRLGREPVNLPTHTSIPNESAGLPASAAACSPSAVTATAAAPGDTPAASVPVSLVNPEGMTVRERFSPPEGFAREAVEPGSFAEYLRNYPLRPDGAAVKYFDGTAKDDWAYIAVADMDLYGSRLQQCADTVLRMNAEYHWAWGEHGRIRYHFLSGFDFAWDKWRQGYRVKVDGNDVSWEKTARQSGSEAVFRQYLRMLYNYANTLSMERYDLESVDPRDIAIGDVFIHGGTPGHVVLVVDMAINRQSGRKCFILLQGYMPAQDAHILRNLDDPGISPWVMLPENPSGELSTPEYRFTWDQAMRFKTQG